MNKKCDIHEKEIVTSLIARKETLLLLFIPSH